MTQNFHNARWAGLHGQGLLVCDCGQEFADSKNNGTAGQRHSRHQEDMFILHGVQDLYRNFLRDQHAEAMVVAVCVNPYSGNAYVTVYTDCGWISTAPLLVAFIEMAQKAQRIAYIYNASRDIGDTETPYN